MAGERMSVVIPAAGMGRRMKSHGPKALIGLGRELLIMRQVRLIQEALPESEIVVVLGHNAERVKGHLPPSVRTVVNEDFEETNVARSTGLGLRACSRPNALVLYGDLVFTQQLLLPFAILPAHSCLVVDRHGQFRDNEVGVNVVEGMAHFLCFALPVKWAHVVYLTEADKQRFLKRALQVRCHRHFGYEVLNALIDEDGPFSVMAAAGPVAEIDTSRDIEQARQIAENDH